MNTERDPRGPGDPPDKQRSDPVPKPNDPQPVDPPDHVGGGEHTTRSDV